MMRQDLQWGNQRSSGLVDVLDRVLDKGLVIAGDIKISIAEVELLTIRIRLIVCSLDKAQEVGLDWWKYDHHLAPGGPMQSENESLHRQIEALERKIAELSVKTAPSDRPTLAVPAEPSAAPPTPAMTLRRRHRPQLTPEASKRKL
jgi:hypothetical protein